MRTIKRFLSWLRFGKVRAETRSVDGGMASEIAYIGRGGKIVGYWAYGHFDPAMPYREQCPTLELRSGEAIRLQRTVKPV
jgi:hypothetical protein